MMVAGFQDVTQYAGAHQVNNRTAAYMLALDRVANAIRRRGLYA
jgi:glutamate dehydrogenase (NAD(P)+)